MKPVFYKDWTWYLKVSIFIVSSITLSYGFYLCCFKEYWYVEYSVFERYISFFNAEALMSFYSVQVTVFTTIYIFLLIAYHNKENKGFFFGWRFKNILVTWNLIMLLIFWIAIFSSMNINGGFSEYTINQLVLSLISHLFCPTLFVVYVIATTGYEKSKYLKIALNDVIVTLAYPIIYLVYINIRAKLIAADPNQEWIFKYWYDFLNFDDPKLELNLSSTLYGFMFIVVFILLYSSLWLMMSWENNVHYKIILNKKNKEREDANEMIRG